MATIHDVAHHSGVSIKTVSRVINKEAGVRPETRDKVEAAVEALGYQPHRGARAMRAGKSGLLGLITAAISTARNRPAQAGLSSLPIVQGVQQVCRERDKMLLIADTHNDKAEERRIWQALEAHGVDGLIYAADHHREVESLGSGKIPVVLANCFDQADTPSVVPDDYRSQWAGLQHLYDLGHRRIALIGLPEDLIAAQLRKQAYDDFRLHFKLPYNAYFSVQTFEDPGLHHTLTKAVHSLLALTERPTALCFGNDLMALRALPVIKAAGLHVPEDLSVIGFDNDQGICEALYPNLSSIVLPYNAIGQTAAGMLCDLIDNGESAQTLYKVPGVAIVRDSCLPSGSTA